MSLALLVGRRVDVFALRYKSVFLNIEDTRLSTRPACENLRGNNSQCAAARYAPRMVFTKDVLEACTKGIAEQFADIGLSGTRGRADKREAMLIGDG